MNQSTTKIRPPALALRLLAVLALALAVAGLPGLAGQALADELAAAGLSTQETGYGTLVEDLGNVNGTDCTARVYAAGDEVTLVFSGQGDFNIGRAPSSSGGGVGTNLSTYSQYDAGKDQREWKGYRETVTKAVFEEGCRPTSLRFVFSRMEKLEAVEGDLSHLAGTSAMQCAFCGCGSLVSVPNILYNGMVQHNWSSSFALCDKLEELPEGALSDWTDLSYYGDYANTHESVDSNLLKNETAFLTSTKNSGGSDPQPLYCSSDADYERLKGFDWASWGRELKVKSFEASPAGADNGSIELTPPEGKELTGLSKGNTVTVAATPAEGYELESLYYVADGSDAQAAIEGGSFVMPASNVTVHATFKKTAAQEAAEKAAAQEAADKINSLGDSPSEEDVEAALAAFNGLSDDEKALVPAATVAKLLGAQQKVAAAKLAKATAEAAAAEESRVKAVSDAVAAQAKAAELQKQVEAAQAAQRAAESKAAEAEKARKAAEAKAAEAEKKAAAAAQPAAKKANTMTAKGKTVTVKLSKAKKKAQTLKASKAFTVKEAQGKVTYKVAKWGKNAKKYLKVASNGKVTVKKGAKKGTYTVKVKVTAAGNAGYKAASKTVTLKVRVA